MRKVVKVKVVDGLKGKKMRVSEGEGERVNNNPGGGVTLTVHTTQQWTVLPGNGPIVMGRGEITIITIRDYVHQPAPRGPSY